MKIKTQKLLCQTTLRPLALRHPIPKISKVQTHKDIQTHTRTKQNNAINEINEPQFLDVITRP